MIDSIDYTRAETARARAEYAARCRQGTRRTVRALDIMRGTPVFGRTSSGPYESEATDVETLAPSPGWPYSRKRITLANGCTFTLAASDPIDARMPDAEPVALDLGPCEWFAGCQNEATHLEPHPILPPVPACDRCPEIGR
jgi:hypothetical protein